MPGQGAGLSMANDKHNASHLLLKNAGWFICGLSGLAVFLLLASEVYYTLCPPLRLDREEIANHALQTATRLGYHLQNLNNRITLVSNQPLLHHIQDHYSAQERRSTLMVVPAYYWQVLWYEAKSKVKLGPTTSAESDLPPYAAKGIAMDFDLNGRAIAFRLNQEETGPLTNLSDRVAAAMADSMLRIIHQGQPNTSPVVRVSHVATDQSASYGFLYTLPEKPYGMTVRFRVEIVGKSIKKWEYIYEPEGGLAPQRRAYGPMRISGFLLLFILYAIYLIKRLRKDLIDFRQAVPIPILLGLSTLVVVLGATWGATYEVMIASLLGAMLLLPLALWIAYACSDSMAREVWEDKLLTLDALYRGYFLNRRFGVSVLTGLAMGAVTLGGFTLILYLAGRTARLDMVSWTLEMNSMITSIPFLSSLSEIANQVLWLQFGVMLFILALLAQYLSKPIWIIGASAVAWGIGLNPLLGLPTAPLWATVAVAAFFGAIQAFVFVRWDFIASMVTQAAWMTGLVVLHLHFLNHPSFYGTIAGLLLIWLALVVFALVALQRPVNEEELKQFLPAHALKIVERMRLRRELEIARDVQLGFLPKQNPQVIGLDVASLCLPALDVAGDYYDFITLDDHRLALAIGDVSGKGISAAFFMTLTKGFLRSLIRTTTSPRQVMVEMNRLYWENVDRAHFISMIYGIFDTRASTLTFVRAGHNPILSIRQQQSLPLIPKGMALGLEKGELFEQQLEEKTVTLRGGDIFVFYTDGFSESRNHRLEEFGETRLIQTLLECDGCSAGDIIVKVKNQVQAFSGRCARHDDMTMVVVRVTDV